MKKSKKPDLVSVMAMIQEKLDLLDKKMDVVIEKTVMKPQAQASQSQQQPPRKERQLYEAVCAQCHKVCEVPFEPREDRPVYCKQCWAQRKSGGRAPVPPSPAPGSAAAPKPAPADSQKLKANKPAKTAKPKKKKGR